MSAGLVVEQLRVRTGGFSLEDLNLEVPQGAYFIVLGPTGSGKTVLLETIAGLRKPLSGLISISGRDVTRLPPERRKVGFVYQDYALFPHLRVRENIAFGLRLRKGRRRDVNGKVQEVCELLGIEHLLERWPGTLSGGEAQRVALARALVTEPGLLLLDEPLSALDPGTREGLQREMKRLHRRLGTTTIHVTHDFEEAFALGDMVAVLQMQDDEGMRKGNIVQVGTPEEVFRRPRSEFVARFVSGQNLFRGEVVHENGISYIRLSPEMRIAVPTDARGPVSLMVRPEDILLSPTPFVSSARNCFRGRVVEATDSGRIIRVIVEVPPRFEVIVTRRSWEDLRLSVGQDVYVTFKASAVHLL